MHPAAHRQQGAPMRRRNYLNAILTVNAALLTGLLWTQVVGRPLVSSARADDDTEPQQGIPNAGKQREVMITQLKSIDEAVRQMHQTLSAGKIKVELRNIDELSKAMSAAAAREQ